jgi:hypothetical protein
VLYRNDGSTAQRSAAVAFLGRTTATYLISGHHLVILLSNYLQTNYPHEHRNMALIQKREGGLEWIETS